MNIIDRLNSIGIFSQFHCEIGDRGQPTQVSWASSGLARATYGLAHKQFNRWGRQEAH